MHPASSAALRTAGSSFPVIQITGTEFPAAWRPCIKSMPDPSFKLMSRMKQTAFSKSVWFLKASADENRMGSYACSRAAAGDPPIFLDRHRQLKRGSDLANTISLNCPATCRSEPAAPSVSDGEFGASSPRHRVSPVSRRWFKFVNVPPKCPSGACAMAEEHAQGRQQNRADPSAASGP
jgi:hypothetical protein